MMTTTSDRRFWGVLDLLGTAAFCIVLETTGRAQDVVSMVWLAVFVGMWLGRWLSR